MNSFLIVFVVAAAASAASAEQIGTIRGAQRIGDLAVLDGVVCEPLDDLVGSLECTFRIVPPSPPSSVTSFTQNYSYETCPLPNMCVATQVAFTNNNANTDTANQNEEYALTASSPGPTIVALVPPEQYNPAPVVVSPVEVEVEVEIVVEQTCPRNQPQSSTQCGGWILDGATSATCSYDRNGTVNRNSNAVTAYAAGATTCHCHKNNPNGIAFYNPRDIQWHCDGDDGTTNGNSGLDTKDGTINIGRVDVTTNNLAVPTATSPPRPIPSTSSTITVPRPINADKCPSTRPFNGQSCSDDPQGDYYRCGYWDQDPNPTKIIDCRCNHVHEFVCNDADSMMYELTSSSSF